uniref:SSD domain-containing protein n=1 Tax=Globodera rostochiensis TaxID=31243 RepID=A0A914I2W9_GLORO
MNDGNAETLQEMHRISVNKRKDGIVKRNEKKVIIGHLHTFCHKWAIFVVKYRNLIMAICSIVSTVGAVKIIKTPFWNDLNGWTPYGARSLAESNVWNQFFNETGTGSNFGIFLLIKPKVIGSNMLQEKMLEEVIRVDDLINWNITLQNHGTNRSEGFAEFCHNFCDINEPMRLFWKGFVTQMQDGAEAAAAGAEAELSLRYPNINVFGRKANIQPHFHGVTFANKNVTSSNMEFVEMIALQYKAERTLLGLSSDEMKEYLIRVSKYFENEFHSDSVRVLSISQSYVEAEFVRASLSMLPYLGIGFGVMAFCTAISIPFSAAYFQQATVHKVSLAIVACICPFMATGTALGLLLFCGMRFSSILCVCPFLVLAIGVDAAFLMTHAWNRFSKNTEDKVSTTPGQNNDVEGQVADIMAQVLKDTGPAILVSALANILADAIGCFIGSPEITLLCLGNMVALAINFVFQSSYFVAVMSTVAIIERKTRKEIGTAKNWQSDFHSKAKQNVSKVVDAYVGLISNWAVASLIAVCSVLFVVFCAIGISNFEVNMTTKQLYSRDSPLLEIDNLREQRIIPSYTMAAVFVNRPGNLSAPAQLAKVNELVGHFERLPESWGASSTMYFVRDFEQFLRTNADDGNGDNTGVDGKANTSNSSTLFDCAHLQEFMNSPEFDYWKGYIRLNSAENNSQCTVDRFFFTTAFHHENLTKWSRRVELLKEWRKTVDEYGKEIEASVHHDEAIFLDLMDNMPTDTWQSAVATLVCMALICLVMLQDWRTVLVATAVIAAIITETLGTLSWTGEALNQLMIGSLIISIGFSVDLPAHFSYHFLTSAALHEGSGEMISFRQKLKSTIRSVGLPSIQASISTGLCVLVDYWVDLYIAQIFVRIMCLTIFLCLINTLLVLPALLTLTNALFGPPNNRKPQKGKMPMP